MREKRFLLLTAVLWCGAGMAVAATLQVGPTKPFQAPCAAIAVAVPGDIIEIDAGLYLGDVCAWNTDNLTIRGVNGRARLDAKNRCRYQELGGDYFDRLRGDGLKRYYVKRLQQLGVTVFVETAQAPA